MKKHIASFFAAAVIFALIGCTAQDGDEANYVHDPLAPKLIASITSELAQPQHVQTIRGVTNWLVCDEYGACLGFMSDSLHSLQLSQKDLNDVKLFLENGMNKIELHFNQTPLTVSAVRWNMEHWYAVKENHDNMDLAINDYEIIEVIDGMMIYSYNEGQRYIYQIHATWQEGFSYFTFRTNPKQH